MADNVRPRQHNRFRHQHRLSTHGVLALLRSGARFTRVEFMIKLGEKKVGQGRIAIAVPKRILNSAVDRNRVKRVIREEFRLHVVRQLPIDMLVTLRAQVTAGDVGRRTYKRDNHQLRQTLRLLLGEVSQRFNTRA